MKAESLILPSQAAEVLRRLATLLEANELTTVTALEHQVFTYSKADHNVLSIKWEVSTVKDA